MHEPPTYDYVDLPDLPPLVPKRGNVFSRGLGRFLLGLFGWKMMGAFPNTPKFVVVALPHTSNWDGIAGLPAAMALGLDISFIAKQSLFKGPIGWFLDAVGGIPVDRSNPGGMVEQAIQEFEQREAFVYGLAPEGTRGRASQWKTGFHRIATAANVPYVVVTFDHKTKQVGPIATLQPSGDAEADMLRLAEVVKEVTPRNPAYYALPGQDG